MTMKRSPRFWPHVLGATALLATLLAGAVPSRAQDGSTSNDLQLAVGAKGGPTGMGATEVPEDSPYRGPLGDGDPEIYGMFGAGYALGLSVDARYNRTVGLETGFYYADDSVDGTNEIQDPGGNLIGTITQTQSTNAFHIPLLVKASPPFDDVRPVFGLGFEFVLQQSSDLSYSAPDDDPGDIRQRAEANDQHNSAAPSNYTLFQFTAGLEIDAGPVRIPIEMRAGYNLGWKDTVDERVDVQNPNGQGGDEQFVYNGEYLGHFGLYAGVLYRWDLQM